MRAQLYTDGGARPTNPGPSGFAFVLVREDGTIDRVSRYAGRGTNNRAEYLALLVGLKHAINDPEVDEIEIVADSLLVINQVSGKWQCKNQALKIFMRECQDLLARHFPERWSFTHVDGHSGDEFNEMCDELCTEVILAARANNPWRKRLSRAS
jgi:ribonuclease HI